MTPLLPKKSDFKQQAPAAHQPWRSAVLADVSRGMGNFSFMHQTHPSAASRKEKTQSLAHPEQSKGGEEISPCELLSRPAQLLEDGFEREARGGDSPELQGLSMVGKHRGGIQPLGWSLPVPWAPLPSKVSPGLGRVVKSFRASWRRKANAASNPEPWGAWHRLHPLNKVPAEKDHVCPAPVGLPCPATHILG